MSYETANMSFHFEDPDNQTTVSDITDTTPSSESIEEFRQRRQEINKLLETELNKLNREDVKEKAKTYGISFSPKLKRPEITDYLCAEFDKHWAIILAKKIPELKTLCKSNKISGITGLKKEELCAQLMTYYAANLILNPDKDATAASPADIYLLLLLKKYSQTLSRNIHKPSR